MSPAEAREVLASIVFFRSLRLSSDPKVTVRAGSMLEHSHRIVCLPVIDALIKLLDTAQYEIPDRRQLATAF